MSSRKALKPVTPVADDSFLSGAPVKSAAPKPTPKPAAPKPKHGLLFKTQMRVELPESLEHIVPVPVSMKIPYQLYKDISEIRELSKGALTATEIFVKSATPEVAELLRQLRERKAQEAQ